MSAPDLAKLREPFPAEQVGKLPRSTKRDNPKGRCNECGGWHGLPAVHLDYVGHAAVTDRLLQADPCWSWEPFALDDKGLPAVVKQGSDWVMWIKLTVCGVTRPGVGIVTGDAFELHKQLISDALRNAAMRFGVALDLWSKEDLHADEPEADERPQDRPTLPAGHVSVADAKRQLAAALQGDKDAAKEQWSAWFGVNEPSGSLPEVDLDELLANAKGTGAAT